MKNIVLSILGAFLLASSTAYAGIIIVLDNSTLSGPPGAFLQFSGTLTNTTNAAVYLNSDSFTLAGLPMTAFDDSPFFSMPNDFLGPNGTTGHIGLFNITVPAPFTTGSYPGSAFTILGGAMEFDSQDNLGSVNFEVDVVQQQPLGGVPEPGTFAFVGAGVSALLAWKRLRNGA